MQTVRCVRERVKRAHLQHGDGSGHGIHAISARIQFRHAGAACLPHGCTCAMKTFNVAIQIALLMQGTKLGDPVGVQPYHTAQKPWLRHDNTTVQIITFAVLLLMFQGVVARSHVHGYEHRSRC